MWVVKNKKGELMLFLYEKPVRDEKLGTWICGKCVYDTKYITDLIFTFINDFLFIDKDLHWEDEPYQVNLMAVPNENNIHTLSIYNAIYKLGEEEGLLRYAERLRVKNNVKKCCDNCKNICKYEYCDYIRNYNKYNICDNYKFDIEYFLYNKTND